MSKPLVSTVLTFGIGYVKQTPYAALVGQLRGVINPGTGQPVASAGMRSLWGEHAKSGETAFDAAVRCANAEFWNGTNPLQRIDFDSIGEPVETEKSINQLFVLRRLLTWQDVLVREGDGIFFAPLDQLAGYVQHGFLTEASVGALGAVQHRNQGSLMDNLCQLYDELS